MNATASTLPLFRDLDGSSYLAGRSVEDRRGSGAVYTPPALVEFILDQARYCAEPEHSTLPLLDPACGAGAFLVGAVRRMARALADQGKLPHEAPGRRLLLGRVRRNVWGVDNDPEACALARDAVREAVHELTGRAAPTGFFHSNVVVADFLQSELRSLPKRVREGLAFVVGNPPYVQTTRLSAESKEQLREQFQTAFGRIDLYALFFERSLGLLRPGGTLAFISPDKYLTGRSMRELRSLILDQSAVRRVAVFRSHKIFHGAATVPCVSVLEKGARSSWVEVSDCLQANTEVRVHRTARVLASERLHAEAWNLLHPSLLRVAERIRGDHPRLETLASRISAGYATGRDGVFVSPNDEVPDVEPELLVPVVRGRDIAPFEVAEPQLTLLLPYTFDGGVPRLIDIREFPRAHRYLKRFRADLRRRHCVRVWEKAWFDIHDPVSLDVCRAEKILVPDVANHNRFAFDPGTCLPLHSAYYVVPKPDQDPLYLTGLLNSAPLEFLVRLAAPVVKDGFRRYRRQFLASLPVPSAPLKTQRSIGRAAKAGDIDRVNRIAAELFGLTNGDLAQIEAYRREQASPHGEDVQ